MGNFCQHSETKKTAVTAAPRDPTTFSQAFDTAQELSKNLASLVLPRAKPSAPEPVTKPQGAPNASPEPEKSPSFLSRLSTKLTEGGKWLAEQGQAAAGWAVEKANQFKNCRSFGEFCSVAGCCLKEIVQGVRDFVVTAAGRTLNAVQDLFKFDRNPFPTMQAMAKSAEAIRSRQEEKKKRCEFYNELRRKKREEELAACEAGDDCDVTNIAPNFADEQSVADLKLAVLFNKVSSRDMVDARRFLAEYELEQRKKKFL